MGDDLEGKERPCCVLEAQEWTRGQHHGGGRTEKDMSKMMLLLVELVGVDTHSSSPRSTWVDGSTVVVGCMGRSVDLAHCTKHDAAGASAVAQVHNHTLVVQPLAQEEPYAVHRLGVPAMDRGQRHRPR